MHTRSSSTDSLDSPVRADPIGRSDRAAPDSEGGRGGVRKPPRSLQAALGELRKQLIDISKRNRLLNAPITKSSAKQLIIQDELADELFRILYLRGRKMTFEPSRSPVEAEPPDTEDAVPLPTDDGTESSGPASHHVDTKLQTRHTASGLQSKLLKLFRDARTIEEEQGVSVLFLALGFLRWFESSSSQVERFAPLILLPVDLTRDSSRGIFRLSFRDQDIEPNRSLGAMMRNDLGLELPSLPQGRDWLPSDYFATVRSAVSSRPRFRVLPNTISLSFFTFAKFLMWNDLSAGVEALDDNSLVNKVLVGGVSSGDSVTSGEENLDRRFPDPKDLGHILDADTSQTQVIAAACQGRNLVVQGPPGTGKSQTIANIIAAVARLGKRVLFVAEKRAALDVVHDRLEKCGLGPLCLELHSHKANRKHVYQDLKRTLELGRPTNLGEDLYEEVRTVRDELNQMSDLVHAIDEPTGETPYGIVGRLSDMIEESRPRPDFQVEGSDSWSRVETQERREAVVALASLTQRFGRESDHLWRGVTRRLDPLERQHLADSLGSAIGLLEAVRESGEDAADAAGLDEAGSIRSVVAAQLHVDALADIPALVRQLLRSQILLERPNAALALCESVEALQAKRDQLLSVVVDSALETRWDETRIAIAAHGDSLFRIFVGSHRKAVARLKGALRGDLPKGREARLELLDGLLEFGRLSRSIAKAAHTGQAALGHLWAGDETDLTEVLPALRWIDMQAGRLGSGPAVRSQMEGLEPGTDFSGLAWTLGNRLSDWRTSWANVVETAGLEVDRAFDGVAIDEMPLVDLRSRLQAWTEDPDSIETWHRLRTAATHASELGLDEIRSRISGGRLDPGQALVMLEFSRAAAIWSRMCREKPDLRAMDGERRSELVERFKEADGKLQSLAATEVALTHFESIPTGSSGQVGLVRGEAAKKTRHLKIRRLMDKAGEAVATIKPVFLMSPLSVAQYLKPGGLTFDILLIDEASQVRPADAVGAIMRCSQIVVVGDQKQMPPTSFFDRQVSGSDEDAELEDEADIRAAQLGEMESVLSLCEARAFPSGMLRWHYRSRHPSLIQASNHEFYDDKLICPPSPDQAGASSGLSFTHVEGEYRRGRKRDNPKEAEHIASEVLRHAREFPDQSLGVVALSVAQRNTILNRIEWMRGENPELEAFCKGDKEDPFFVKNLENVQGDERDVIFISIGYGKDEGGYMSQNFGPVSSEGGERRLNVLFTRSKRRCRVFASIRHSDIRVDTTKHRGPRVLKRFLKYAETGDLDIPVLTGGEPDSPFESAVAKAITSHGYRVEGQVGSAGFLIDLAVYDPDDEGRFLLAVECDGARYHSSSWARERDRLRQAVLEGKGWRFHRIWSTDWFYNRQVELDKLLTAIERARSGSGSGGVPSTERAADEARQGDRSPESAPAGPEHSGHSGARAETSSRTGFEIKPHDRPSGSPAPRSAGLPKDGSEDAAMARGRQRGGEEPGAGRSAAAGVIQREARRPDPVPREEQHPPYVEAVLETYPRRIRGVELHECPIETPAAQVVEVVQVEGPVHRDVIAVRIKAAWGYGRLGKRIRLAVNRAIDHALRAGSINRASPESDAFFDVPRPPSHRVTVRDRSAASGEVRSPGSLPPTEVRAGIVQVVAACISVSPAECARDVARMLGFKSTGARIRELVLEQAEWLVAAGELANVGGELRLP